MQMSFDSEYTMTIGGRPYTSATQVPSVDPATEAVIAHVPDCSFEQLNEAVVEARAAFPKWAATPVSERQKAVRAIGDVLKKYKSQLSTLLTREQGKPIKASRDEVDACIWWCNETASLTPAVTVLEDTPKSRVEVRHIPVGVVGAIVPWNFPISLAMWKIAPALIAGNTVILKPSPFTPLTTLKLGELLRGLLPPGVLNVISGSDTLGPWMSSHPGIDKISFTGSTPTGRRVMQSAAVNLKRLTLELGGNDAAIVMPDVDVDRIVPLLFWGAFANSSQFCLAIKRLYVHEDIYDRILEKLRALAETVKMGPGNQDGVMLGPIQNRVQYDRLILLMKDCEDNGYRFACGGRPTSGPGLFIPVTLVDNPPDSSRIVSEEPFGPILPILRFRDVDDVIARANNSEYGLGGSVWCGDERLALKIAERLQVGSIWVNEIHSLNPNKPMAGHKQSGVGVENGLEGLHEYTVVQTISVRKLPTSVQL